MIKVKLTIDGSVEDIEQAVEKQCEQIQSKIVHAFSKSVDDAADMVLDGLSRHATKYGETNNVSVGAGLTTDYDASITILNGLFLEYGTGIKYQAPHPDGKYGAGTWSDVYGKGHWKDKDGWFDPMGKHHYGCPPAMVVYGTKKEFPTLFKNRLEEEFK